MRIALTILLCWLPNLVQAMTLPELQQRLSAQKNFSASLTQTKTLKGWSKPLKASGMLAYTPEHGVLYHLQKPLTASYWLQHEQISVRENNAATRVMLFTQMPWLASISTLLVASVSGDWPRLQQQFDLNLVSKEGEPWRIELLPLHAPLKDNVLLVKVIGTQQIDRIIIHDKKGDITDIALTQYQPLNSDAMNATLKQLGLL